MRSKSMSETSESAFSPPVETPAVSLQADEKTGTPRPRLRTVMALPLVIIIAFAIHYLVSKKEPAPQMHVFSVFLAIVFVLASLFGCLQLWLTPLRRWVGHMFPIIAAAMLSLSLWE